MNAFFIVGCWLVALARAHLHHATTHLTASVYIEPTALVRPADLKAVHVVTTKCSATFAGETMAIYETTFGIAFPDGSGVCWTGGFSSTSYTAFLGLFVSPGLDSSQFSSVIAAQCFPSGDAVPAWLGSDASPTSFAVTLDSTFITIPGANIPAFSNYLCSLVSTSVPSACTVTSAPPGEGYVVAFNTITTPITLFGPVCTSLVHSELNVFATYVSGNVSPVPTTALSSLAVTCPESFGQTRTALGSTAHSTLSQIVYDGQLFSTTTAIANSGVVAGLCTFQYISCPTTFSSWYIQSVYPALTYGGWSSFCQGQISDVYTATFATPDPSDSILLSGLSSIYSACGFTTNVFPYTAGDGSPDVPSNSYAFCSWTPLNLNPSTVFTSTTITTQTTTTVTTLFLSTSTVTEVSTSQRLTTDLLISSTTTTTTTTSTDVESSVSSTTTTTTSTTTSTRIISDSTTTTTTVSFTISSTFTARTTGSFTETVRSTLRTTVTRTVFRTSCDRPPTTVTTSTTQTRTFVTTDLDTAFVDVTVFVTETQQETSRKQKTATRTLCSTYTDVVVTTDIVFKRKQCGANCPDIEAVVCGGGGEGGDAGPVYMFNALPYDLANCACQAVNRAVYVVRPGDALAELYALAARCGGSAGQAWVQVAADFTRCYVVLAGERRIVPALTCDIALPVICQ